MHVHAHAQYGPPLYVACCSRVASISITKDVKTHLLGMRQPNAMLVSTVCVWGDGIMA